jgi:hypothetical protein
MPLRAAKHNTSASAAAPAPLSPPRAWPPPPPLSLPPPPSASSARRSFSLAFSFSFSFFSAVAACVRLSLSCTHTLSGAQFTCFTSTKVQILTQKRRSPAHSFCVSICTFVLVNWAPYNMYIYTHTHTHTYTHIYIYIYPEANMRASRQYLYFCTSKASKLSTL